MIDMLADPEQWTVETKAPIPVNYGIVRFCLIQYQRRIFLFGGNEGNQAGTGSQAKRIVREYYIDEDRLQLKLSLYLSNNCGIWSEYLDLKTQLARQTLHSLVKEHFHGLVMRARLSSCLVAQVCGKSMTWRTWLSIQ